MLRDGVQLSSINHYSKAAVVLAHGEDAAHGACILIGASSSAS